MKYRRITTILFVILIIATTWLMLIPNPPQVERNIPHMDKIEHAAAFLLLSFLLTCSIPGRKGGSISKLIQAVVVLSLYGLLMEILQQYTGRNTEPADFAADIAGALIGGMLSIFFCD